MKANKYIISKGVGISKNGSKLAGFDKALIDAGVANYNLVKLSSILPANCIHVEKIDIQEGSLLPTAYATVSSDKEGDYICSNIMIGFPEEKSNVGVIMEYSCVNKSQTDAKDILYKMVEEAFEARGWKLARIEYAGVHYRVKKGECATTFACVAEW